MGVEHQFENIQMTFFLCLSKSIRISVYVPYALCLYVNMLHIHRVIAVVSLFSGFQFGICSIASFYAAGIKIAIIHKTNRDCLPVI